VELTAPKITGRRMAAVSLLGVALLGAAGCSFTSEEATTIVYSPSDGMRADVGDAQVRNLLLVSKAPASAGRFLGSVFNDSQQPLEVVITIEEAGTRLTVPAGGRLELGDPANEHIVPDTGSFPGGLAEATIEAGGVSLEDQIPVLDGTLEEYRPYVPGGWNPATIDHLYTTPAAPEGGH
jgi:hypothetical protein